MENNPQFSSNFGKDENNIKKKEFRYHMEEHSLSLRKKLNNKGKRHILPNSLTNDLTYEINLRELEPKINNHQLYVQFKNASNEKDSLGLLFQMLLIEDNNDILKYSLGNLKIFLINIDENDFISKNMSMEFNDKLIKYLFDLLLNKTNDFYILSNICFILNKLSFLLKNENSFFFNILYQCFNNILDIIKNINPEEPQVKNLLFLLTGKIFLASDEIISKFEKNYPQYIQYVHQEILKSEQNNFVKNMCLISTLLQIISNCFFYQIYSDYFFSSYNNDPNVINIENIFQSIQKLLNFSYQMEIFEQELRCIQNFLCLFMEKEEFFKNKNLKKKIQKIIKNLEFEKKILPLIYDNTVNEPTFRLIALQIFVNATFICTKNFCEKLIENNIAEQIIKLENYLINQTQITNRIKNLYRLLMDLIYNLIENESVYIIDNLSIDNSCISLLFKLQKIPFYSKENKSYMIKIFNILIQSNHKYIQTLLISEGICEWYKSILEDEPNKENIAIIISNFMTMVQYSSNLIDDKSNKNNLLLIHLEKIGISEIVTNLKSRNDLSNDEIEILNEFSNLFK